jgi:phage terminase large subunit-like protein
MSTEQVQTLLSQLSPEDAETLSEAYRQLQNLDRTNFIDTFFPDEGPLARHHYKKHLEFFAAGPTERERAFIAGNRIGKSTSAGGYETACHLMGDYPPWWPGRRFDRPVRAWAAGDTGETVREIIQPILIGDIASPGNGLIRATHIEAVSNKRGSPEAVEKVTVTHSSGGSSTLLFKSYEQGRKAFQGTKMDLIWLDEEPSMSIYAECLLRLTATTPEGTDWGSLLCTFTPLLGISDVVLRYIGANMGQEVQTHTEFLATQATQDVVELPEPRDLLGPPDRPRYLTDSPLEQR